VEGVTSLYYLKYGPFTLATTRPETKFGDTAVAVHPQDERYKEFVGKEIEVEGLNGPFKLKVIADEYVDRKFGTGVVKITPYHDFNDFEVWQRHKAELPAPQQVIGHDGRLTEIAGKYAGLKVAVAREQVVADLTAKGLIVRINDKYQNSVGVCYRCGTAIEPLPLPQFYVKVKPLTEKVLAALDAGEVKIHGAGHDKILRHWLNNLDDWNISRQIVWGIRLPVWYAVSDESDIRATFIDTSGQKHSGLLKELLKTHPLTDIRQGLQTLDAPITAEYVISPTQPSPNHLQETDTFDTWFSSSQWPFATLQNTQPGDFERFYPTAVMETGYDILPIWVLRMLMMGFFATGKAPFKDVYLHGLVRDHKGQKMSKSKGNVVNPLEITKIYGADALRMALVIRSSAGLDKSVGEADFKATRNLTNKLWNAARYVLLALETQANQPEKATSAPNDEAFLTRLTKLRKRLTENFSKLQLGLAAEIVYTEFWHWYCDEAIEQAKTGQLSPEALFKGLLVFLKLTHPFMPFVTEAIWQQLKEKQLVTEPYLITTQW
jgi:valyl-tRNA synthetase